jgi:predicted DNA-binding WGR domain protein
VNPSDIVDSTFELDSPKARARHWGVPQDEIQYLVLDRRDPGANMARFYVLSIEASLFGDVALIREWGRIGTAGQRKIELHSSEGSAMKALEVWLHRKQRWGYVARSGGRLGFTQRMS